MLGGGAHQLKQDQADKRFHPQNARNNQTHMGGNPSHLEIRNQTKRPTDLTIAKCSDKLHRVEEPLGSLSQKEAPGSLKVDQVMTELESSPDLSHDRPNPENRRHPESTHTSKAKLNFGYRESNSHQAPNSAANTNPFAALEADNLEIEDSKDNQEDSREGWTFQGRRKHIPRIALPRQAFLQSPTPTPNQEVTPGGRRKQMHLEVHHSYFTSLGIPMPPGQ